MHKLNGDLVCSRHLDVSTVVAKSLIHTLEPKKDNTSLVLTSKTLIIPSKSFSNSF